MRLRQYTVLGSTIRPKNSAVLLTSVLFFGLLVSGWAAGEMKQVADIPGFNAILDKTGLTKEQAKDVLSWVAKHRLRSQPPPMPVMSPFQADNRDIVPFLVSLLHVSGYPELKSSPENGLPSKHLMCYVLSVYYRLDPRPVPELLAHARRMLARPIKCEEDELLLIDSILYLCSHSDAAVVAFFFRVQSQDFWNSKEAPRIDLPGEESNPTGVACEGARNTIRQLALSGLAWSGTDFALDTFATGKGLNLCRDDCSGYFEVAVRKHVGVGYPEYEGQPLPKDKEAEIQKIYSQHGFTFVPTPVHGHPIQF